MAETPENPPKTMTRRDAVKTAVGAAALVTAAASFVD